MRHGDKLHKTVAVSIAIENGTHWSGVTDPRRDLGSGRLGGLPRRERRTRCSSIARATANSARDMRAPCRRLEEPWCSVDRTRSIGSDGDCINDHRAFGVSYALRNLMRERSRRPCDDLRTLRREALSVRRVRAGTSRRQCRRNGNGCDGCDRAHHSHRQPVPSAGWVQTNSAVIPSKTYNKSEFTMNGSTKPARFPTDNLRTLVAAHASRDGIRRRWSGRTIAKASARVMVQLVITVPFAYRRTAVAAAVAAAGACCVPHIARAQRTGSNATVAANASHAIGTIKGRIVLPQASRPTGLGSVSVRRFPDSAFVNGAFPDSVGAFVVAGLPTGRYVVRIRVLGYLPIVRPDVRISSESSSVDLGDIPLVPAAVRLESQTITADQPDVALEPDRSSYSVKNLATTAGGTALDVLRHLPGVSVDATGLLPVQWTHR